MRTAILAALTFVCGLGVGSIWSGRYELVANPDSYPLRFDRWTGRVEIVDKIDVSPEARKFWAPTVKR